MDDESISWVRRHITNLQPLMFYDDFGYSYICRKDAENDLKRALEVIAQEKKSGTKAKQYLCQFKKWTQSRNCEYYWFNLEKKMDKVAYDVVGRKAAYRSLGNYIKKVNAEDESLEESYSNSFSSSSLTVQTKVKHNPFKESSTNDEDENEKEDEDEEGGTENANVAEEESEGESEEESGDKDVFVTLKEIEEAFRNMDDNQKWRLSTGKVVEDTLFEYGRKCKSEHLSQSFIVDPEDTSYIAHGVFTEEELAEIEETDTKPLPDIPMDLMKYMNSFRQSSVKELRTQLSVVQYWEGASFKTESHFDYDWIKNSVHNLVQEYEGDNLVAGRSESHYLMHCWHIIDRCFLNLQDLHCVRGEASSFASSYRKNRTRHVSGLMQVARKMMGRRGDLIFRKHHNEYGNGEAGKQWEGENGSKILKERGLKAPKMQKDMFINLCHAVKWDMEKVRKLQVIGWIFSELSVLLLRLDSPRGYVCRVVRSPTYTIPQGVALFGQQVIPFLALVWKVKAIIKEVVDVIESTQDRDSEEDQLQELQSVGVKRRKSYHFRINDSVHTPSKKNRI